MSPSRGCSAGAGDAAALVVADVGGVGLPCRVEVLEDDDDVQRVTANFEVSDDVLEQLSA